MNQASGIVSRKTKIAFKTRYLILSVLLADSISLAANSAQQW
jgi:hypothetical protein